MEFNLKSCSERCPDLIYSCIVTKTIDLFFRDMLNILHVIHIFHANERMEAISALYPKVSPS
jgi:hypothetical protein